LHGSSFLGGDVNELRLKSDTNLSVRLDADRGTLDLHNVKVISWDETTGGPDTDNAIYLALPRAYIRARSRLVGTNVQQSTLNVVNSEIGWLGFGASDTYGLTWEVVGNVPGVSVFGSVSGSFIHDCQLPVSSWGADNVSWSGNQIATNVLYGFDANN